MDSKPVEEIKKMKNVLSVLAVILTSSITFSASLNISDKKEAYGNLTFSKTRFGSRVIEVPKTQKNEELSKNLKKFVSHFQDDGKAFYIDIPHSLGHLHFAAQ